jgi:hypothetical protein
MSGFLKTAGLTLVAHVLIAVLAPPQARAQFVQVYHGVVTTPVVTCYPPVTTVHYAAPVVTAPVVTTPVVTSYYTPVVTPSHVSHYAPFTTPSPVTPAYTSYYAPVVTTPVYHYSFYQPTTTVFSAPVATTVYSPAVATMPSTVTTRTYRGFGIFRPRGLYTETYAAPSTSFYTPAYSTSYYTPLYFRY